MLRGGYKTTPEADKPQIVFTGKAQYSVSRFVPLKAGLSPFKKEYYQILSLNRQTG